MKINILQRLCIVIIISYVISGCATYKTQYGKNNLNDTIKDKVEDVEILKSFYLLGNVGDLDLESNHSNINQLKKFLEKTDSVDYLFLLGNNILPNGVNPKKNLQNTKIKDIASLINNFKGKTIIIPGNKDWGYGLNGLNKQQDLLRKEIKKPFVYLPENGCAIGNYTIDENTEAIIIDSQWYLENWDKNSQINDNCLIKNREDFFTELDSQLDKFDNKTVLILMHHPITSNGIHGGKYSYREQLYPFQNNFFLPVVGSLLSLIRGTSGLSKQDLQSFQYREFKDRLNVLVQSNNNVIVISAHDNSLQYIERGNLKQIISGATSLNSSAKVVRSNDFSSGNKGFARLNYHKDKTFHLNFYQFENDGLKLLLDKKILDINNLPSQVNYSIPKDIDVNKSVYSIEQTEVSNLYKFFFGEHYRPIFSKDVTIPNINLETYKNGLYPVKIEDDDQINILKLRDNNQNFYDLKSVKKSALRYLQSVAYKNDYVVNEFENTLTEKFLMDYYTVNHPYYPMIVPSLLNNLGYKFGDATLLYLPKQNSLEEYNKKFGNELYFLEPLPKLSKIASDGLSDTNKMHSTEELIVLMSKNANTSVDKNLYMRARLFDMLVGDWQRGSNQWDWAEFKELDTIVYKPIPKTREQVFPKYDGLFFNIIFGNDKNFGDNIINLKKYNEKSYALDLAILEASDLDAWLEQAKYIQENLDEEKIRQAFSVLPDEVKSKYDEEVIDNILKRKDKLTDFAKKYHQTLSKLVILKGTDEDDTFLITRLSKGLTNIKIFSGKDNKLIFDRNFNIEETKEIRLYGLNGSNTYKLEGKTAQPIFIRIIGGSGTNNYEMDNYRNVKIYGYKEGSKNSSSISLIKRRFTNDYMLNTYDYTMPKYNSLGFLPNISFNPDDGVMLGVASTYTINGFNRNPFSSKHQLKLSYFFATRGIEIIYKGHFRNVFGTWNLDVNGRYTAPTFTNNFFGLGNQTENNQKELGLNYNRLRQQVYEIGPSFYKLFKNNSRLDIFTNYKFVRIQKTPDRIVDQSKDVNKEVFRGQNFTEFGANYLFMNYDNQSLPTLGVTFLANAKWNINNEVFAQNHLFTELNFGVTQKITSNGKLTLSSLIKGKAIFGFYEFYQAAILGGDNDLRGYRVGRFSGDRAFLHSTDIRAELFNFKAGIPIKFGVFSGVDYGRVWYDKEHSNKVHSSFGGGIWLNGASIVTGKVSVFKGEDPMRIVFGFSSRF